MSRLKLVDNERANWNSKEFYYDENGQAHEQHLHWGNDYTLEEGDMIDDAEAIESGQYLGDPETFDHYQEEWN